MPVDPSSDRAVHKQIADQLRGRIVSGDLQPGDRIPSERQLQDTYQVSRVTSRLAVSVLTAEGLVRPVHGSGVFVTHPDSLTVAYWQELADRLYRLLFKHSTCPTHQVDHDPDCPDCLQRERERTGLAEYRAARRHVGGWTP